MTKGNTAQRMKRSNKQLSVELERMINRYVNVVLSGQPERRRIAARAGLRVIVQRAVRGALREVRT